jgi:hypothetical protein
LNSVTGEPIHNALVTLTSDEGRSVFTATDGSFEFRDLKEVGERSIFAKRPGYFSPQMVRLSQSSTSSTAIPVRIGPDQPPLILRLVPEGLIAGRVTTAERSCNGRERRIPKGGVDGGEIYRCFRSGYRIRANLERKEQGEVRLRSGFLSWRGGSCLSNSDRHHSGQSAGSGHEDANCSVLSS